MDQRHLNILLDADPQASVFCEFCIADVLKTESAQDYIESTTTDAASRNLSARRSLKPGKVSEAYGATWSRDIERNRTSLLACFLEH